LRIMRFIDETFLLVHPRATRVSPGAGIRALLPEWLRDARDRRMLTGAFAYDQEAALVPRGPLLRGARHVAAASADSLADRFSALCVAPTRLSHDGRSIGLALRMLSTSASRGIAPGARTGAEAVAFIPIAQSSGDLSVQEREASGQTWVDFQTCARINPATSIVQTLRNAQEVDIALAPEFLVSEDRADELAAALLSNPMAPRLLVAGSGTTRARLEGQAWNEARVLNACGAELWRQRKIWPASIDQERAIAFGLKDPGPGAQVFEDTAAGDVVHIIDADGLGRCAVLICQDLQMRPLADELIKAYQPDWMFIPILDTGVAAGRWMHQRAYELSATAQTRFLVVSSTALAERAGVKSPFCALAVGPREPSNLDGHAKDVPRALALARSGDGGTDSSMAIIRWRFGRWLRTSVGQA